MFTKARSPFFRETLHTGFALLMTWSLSGCSHGGAVSALLNPAGGSSAGTTSGVSRFYTAKMRIDVGTGEVQITPTPGSRAAFSGDAISVFGNLSLVDAGELNRYRVSLRVNNRSNETIGNVTNPVRVVFDNLRGRALNVTDQTRYYQVETVVGAPGVAGDVSGPLNQTRLNGPRSVAVLQPDSFSKPWLAITDSLGRVLAADLGNGTVRELARFSGTTPNVLSDVAIETRRFTNRVFVANTTTHTIMDVGEIDTTEPITPIVFFGKLNTAGHFGGDQSNAASLLDGPKALSAKQDFVVDANGFRPTVPVTGSWDGLTTLKLSSLTPVDIVGASVRYNQFGNVIALTRSGQHTIQIHKAGVSTPVVVAGGAIGYNEGNLTTARFSAPSQVEWYDVNTNGTLQKLIIADTGNNRIRSLFDKNIGFPTSAFNYQTALLAGTGVAGFRDGPANVAQFNSPSDIAVANNGDIYVADRLNHVIRRVRKLSDQLPDDPDDSASTGSSQPIGTPTAKYFPRPNTIIGTPYYEVNSIGAGNTASLDVEMTLPEGVNIIEASINVEADTETVAALEGFANTTAALVGSNRAYVRTLSGRIDGFGFLDGVGASALYGGNIGVCSDKFGNLYIADGVNGVIRMLKPDNTLTTIIGDPFNASTLPVDGDGFAEAGAPFDIACNPEGERLFWTDSVNHVIRSARRGGDPRSRSSWAVTTLYGTAGSPGDVDGTGATARLRTPHGIAYDPGSGAVYIADTGNHRIKSFTVLGTPTQPPLRSLAGNGSPGAVNGRGTAARFNTPQDVAVTPNGDVVIADQLNGAIRRMTPAGVVILTAGQMGTQALADSQSGNAARFNSPFSVAVDSTGYIYVADKGSSYVIRRVSPTIGETKTVAGQATVLSNSDGLGDEAGFLGDQVQIAFKPSGDLAVGINGAVRLVQRVVSPVDLTVGASRSARPLPVRR